MALHPPNQEADQRRFSSLSEIRFNARSFLEGFPTPTPSSRYSHQSLPEHTEREHRRRSSGFNAIRDMLGHGRHASASARSSTSHLPLTQSEDIEHGEHDHHEEDDEDEELEELETRQNHHSMIYSPLSRPQSWHIAPPTEPHPALLRPREPSISPPRFREERDLEAQTTTTNTSPAAQRRRKKKKKRSNNGGYWLRRTPGTTRRERETCVPDTIKGRTTGTMVTGFVLIVLISTYLGVALSQSPDRLKIEFHVLLGLTIFATTCFFARNLFRLTILLRDSPIHNPNNNTNTTRRSPPNSTSRRPHIRGRSTSGRARIPSQAFAPDVPILVHLAADEEIQASHEDGSIESSHNLESLKAPPPAYGLWRSSVKANPAYLHWVRADSMTHLPHSTNNSTTALIPSPEPGQASTMPSIGLLSRMQPVPEMVERGPGHPSSRLSMIGEEGGHGSSGPRPPSYMTDDGIEILLQPTLRGPGMVLLPPEMERDEVHPAHRVQQTAAAGAGPSVTVRSMLDV